MWGFLLVVILTISGAYLVARTRAAHPALPVLGQLSNFTLTNQAGQTVTLDTLRGQVWVANIIFSRCPGPCSKMTKKMAELQALLPKDQPVKLISLTSDPEFDTPAVLTKYAQRFGVDFNRWSFLTGSKREIQQLAVNGLKMVLIEKQPADREIPADLFIHSTLFVLVDKQGRVRASLDMLPPPPLEEGNTNAASIPPEMMKERDSTEHVAHLIQQLLEEK